VFLAPFVPLSLPSTSPNSVSRRPRLLYCRACTTVTEHVASSACRSICLAGPYGRLLGAIRRLRQWNLRPPAPPLSLAIMVLQGPGRQPTRLQLLGSLTQPLHWSGMDSARYSLLWLAMRLDSTRRATTDGYESSGEFLTWLCACVVLPPWRRCFRPFPVQEEMLVRICDCWEKS
jgi:hypothetical protein